jgi:hypothetical protein
MMQIYLSDMKRCSKCKKVKALEEFYKNSSSKDGRQTYCKQCQTEKYKSKEYRVWKRQYDMKEDQRTKRKERQDNNRDNLYKSQLKWRNENVEKVVAHEKLNYAIRKGIVVKKPCWCGNEKSQAHHEDYSKPLDVVWLCAKHHKQRHNEREQSTPYVKAPNES